MGCGNRIDPTKLHIMDIAKTSMDPLAKVIRKGLKDRRIKGVKVLCSTEEPIVPVIPEGGVAEGKGTARQSGSWLNSICPCCCRACNS